MSNFSGASTAATGAIANLTASPLVFSDAKCNVIVSNRAGAVCYCKINDDTSTPTASDTVFDFALADGGTFVIQDAQITNITVYVAAIAGVYVVGWD